MGGFCEKFLPSDRWQWSDVSGLQHRPLDGVALPSRHWEWESDWYVDENFGGEPTEKGVGEFGSRWGSPVGKECLGLDPSPPHPRPVPSPAPQPAPCMLPLAARDRWLLGLWPISLSPSLFHSAPRLPRLRPSPGALQSPPPPRGLSGVDVRHRLPRHLHEGQEVEFLCAAAEVDPL